jgi:hypothetical protein
MRLQEPKRVGSELQCGLLKRSSGLQQKLLLLLGPNSFANLLFQAVQQWQSCWPNMISQLLQQGKCVVCSRLLCCLQVCWLPTLLLLLWLLLGQLVARLLLQQQQQRLLLLPQQHRLLARLLLNQARAPWLCGTHICTVLLLLLPAMLVAMHMVARGCDCPPSKLGARPEASCW